MKKIGAIIAILFIPIISHAGESLDSLFIKANEVYSTGDFEESYALYSKIQKQGYESPELYFNMGNAAFRSNKLGYAILYFEKALKLNPSYEDAQKNLKYVSVYKEDHLEEVPDFFLKTWIQSLFSVFSLSFWSYISVALFVLTLTGILVYIYARRLAIKKTGFYASLIFIIIFALSISAAIQLNRSVKYPEKAVIISPSVVVKSSPSLSGTDLFILHEGTLVSIDEEVGEWIEIKISDGRVGWIQLEEMHSI